MTKQWFPQRKSPRLTGYDYTQAGAYFVTICTYQRQHLFGNISNERMLLTQVGEIATERWYVLPEHHRGVELDAFVVMPNHMHGIIVVGTMPASSGADNTGVVPTGKLAAGSLGAVVGSYKSGVTRRIREALGVDDLIVWQGRYHDHIIRDERGLNAIRQYVHNNVALWQQDTFYGIL